MDASDFSLAEQPGAVTGVSPIHKQAAGVFLFPQGFQQ
jgi:hypothetical protein